MSHFKIVPFPTSAKGPAMKGFSYADGPIAADETQPGIWRYWRRLPVEDPSQAVSLGEGNTPLLRSRSFQGADVWFKDETRNPTGSHKDRQLAIALTHARAVGADLSVVVSAGSTGIAHAAYAAAAGIPSLCFMTSDAPVQRVYPVQALGSEIVFVDAGIDEIIERLRQISVETGVAVGSTTRRSNPYQAEGGKTIAYEIAAMLGDAPHWMVVPVGGGGTLASLWRGFEELAENGQISRKPRMLAVVPDKYDALAVALRNGIVSEEDFAALPYEETIPTILAKLAHGHPPDGPEALAALRASNGSVFACTDQGGIDGALRIARGEGLYIEPSSGVIAPAIDHLISSGLAQRDEQIVALACGCGFRETSIFIERTPFEARRHALSEVEGLVRARRADGRSPRVQTVS